MLCKLLASAALAAALSSAALANDGVLDVVAPFEIKGADPVTSGNIFIKMDVAETLVNVDAAGRLTPGLATAWRVSDDGLEWRFHLREGVRFHDGSPFTAEAAANALNIARAKPGLLETAPITEIVGEGGDLLVRLSEPFAPMPAFLSEYRSLIYAPAAYAKDGSVAEVIGTGAYRVTKLEAPLRLEAEAFAGYWGDAPAIGRATYQAVGRAETRALLAESGDADYVFNLDPASTTRLASVDSVEVLTVSVPRTLLLKVNAGHPALSDPRARQALGLAIDREGLAEAVLRFPAGGTQLFPPSLSEWHDDELEPLTHDPEKARAMLAELGWAAGADGILTRDGQRFSLTLTTFPDRPELPLSAAVLQQMFADIGVEMMIDSTNSSEIPVRHADGTLDLALFNRNFALVPDPVGTLLTDYAPTGDWGAMNWDNAEFTGLVRGLARGEGGHGERDRAIAILQEELPVIPIAWYQQFAAVSTGITGAVIDPYERSIGLKEIRWAE
ncbi:ABC transporter substrate-binding protein [Paracoccus denitrificans]|jgi:peptide/nickel transport system substrate-binding protein|uniref:Extracellular solute-binding protein, family 5 n=1 Tax=Paracoccus denitrificans (strain Pd 1222) TaxID=318586 RepID=A1B1Q2_PARDP|nr:ABC transporter substrate-binding protein [Paracoccus denitrificans]ABL69446.1 extracellular solute-binding protein, family 5 [Paracoccus denitrificans PD1222]MBB4626690.1 peptide/nickel transport system substrate-binding protein [Paracoccus denitrificans]MCU7427824.1 ABC transporter substrate-binding protein [Paracoccus denitrificans]QAR25072.1 ABC transporter substrate-binding protein [Paracoccus denitrificans]UPV93743.1 ABC transporter substrate-binding protein [Paracoccus denitrificans]